MAIVLLGRLDNLKKSNDIGNRTRDLSTCSIVLTPKYIMINHKVLITLQPDGQAFDQQNIQNDSLSTNTNFSMFLETKE
jgi:hypothetical protein